MGLQVTKNISGREQNLYLKIDALLGNKNHTTVIANYYWERDVSADLGNTLGSEEFSMHFDRNSEGNPIAVAYASLKTYLDDLSMTYTDVDSVDETPLSTASSEPS